MFGYVRPAMDELKVHQAATYRAYYCGVCKGLGKQCGPLCRAFLQFDFALLALVIDLAVEEPSGISPGRCSINPLQKLPIAKGPAISYASDAHGLLLLGKSLDDRADGDAKGVLTPLMKAWAKGAQARQPELATAMQTMLLQQVEVEAHYVGLEDVSEPFAVFCRVLFTPPKILPEHAQALAWLGYNLGRWIYIADALDDLERDDKKKQFNPLLPETRQTAAVEVLPLMNLCAFEALKALDLLPEHRNIAIARNILDEGLVDAAQMIAGGTFSHGKSWLERYHLRST